MKKFRRTLALILCVAALLSVCAFAEPDTGFSLNVFEDVADMTNFTFSDVNSNNWSYNNIKVAYDKGILIGYPGGTFRPYAYVTWSHAFTIAARIHSAYNGYPLSTDLRPGDRWFAPYQRYCEIQGLIPDSCPKNVNLDYVAIPRYALAYIFSRTIDAEDMPVISDLKIADLNKIPAEYVESVKLLYSAGIMNGFEDNSFHGNSLTTREQIAAVVDRLLLPSDRIGRDARVNSEMAAFEANLENDSPAVQIGANYYCVYKYYDTTDTELSALFCTTGNNDAKRIYTCAAGERLDNLSVYNGKVYFCVSTMGTCNGKLMCYDPASGNFSTVYEGNATESYCFYNGNLYALLFTEYGKPVINADGSMDLSAWKYQFGRISGGEFLPLLGEMDYYRTMYFVPYGWNGCIYFKLGNLKTVGTGASAVESYVANLYEYCIDDGNLQQISDLDINTSFFDGHVMYFMAYDSEGNYDLNLYSLSLQAPSVIKTIGEFPATTDKRYRSIYKHDDTFYCLSSMNRNLYSMDENGESKLALICGGAYNACCFTKDSMILIPNTVSTANMNEVKIYDAKSLSSRELYGDWMGQSCYYKGARFVPDNDQPVYSSGDESVSTVSDIEILVPEAFMRDGDLVVRTKYTNNIVPDEAKNTETYVCLRMYVIKVYQGNTLVASDINKMQTMELKPYDVETFTFVVGGDDILGNIDVSSGDFSVEVIPTYDIKIVQKTGSTTT